MAPAKGARKREYERMRQERYWKKGICLRCRNKRRVPAKRYCESCLKFIAEHQKKRRAEFRTKGICVKCKQRGAVEGKIYCKKCLEAISDYYRKRRETSKIEGICLKCKIAKPVDGYACCEKCREEEKKYDKERIIKFKKTGLCSKCGRNKPVKGSRFCRECGEKSKKSAMGRLNKAKSDGLCERCLNHPRATGDARCTFCIKSDRKRQQEFTRRTHIEGSEVLGGKCQRCGETRHEFLTIHHKTGRMKHDKDGGHKLLRKIIRGENSREGLEQLCWNCHALLKRSTKVTERQQFRRIKHDELQVRAFEYYGNKCKCCGEARKETLEIHHTMGGGVKERKQSGHYGWRQYEDLGKNGWPKKGIQIMCSNCNHALAIYESCPHECNSRQKGSQ
ncbi:MAG: hypothetical protein V2A66_05900 [Pseudomonadota bacterium]